MTEPKPKSTTRAYMVGYVTGDHLLKMVGSYVASTPKGAVERCVEEAAGELPQTPLNFVAVVASSWNAFHGAGEMKMVFAISDGHKAPAESIDGPHNASDEPQPPQPAGPTAVVVNPETALSPEDADAQAEAEAAKRELDNGDPNEEGLVETEDAVDLTTEQERVIAEAEAGDFGEVG